MVCGSDEFASATGGLRISRYRGLCSMVRVAVFLSMVLVAAAAAGAGISGVASVSYGGWQAHHLHRSFPNGILSSAWDTLSTDAGTR